MLNLGKTLTKITGRTGLKIKKFSPELLVYGGIVGVVVSTVMAVKATKSERYKAIIATHEYKAHQIERATEIVKNNGFVDEDEQHKYVYTEQERKEDLISMYKETGLELIKLYWPSVTLQILSIAAILGGFKIIKNRNVALIAAYNIIDKTFKDYRGRVIKELGSEKDKHFLYDTIEQESTVVTVDEDGKKIKTKSTDQIINGNVVSMYARLFNEGLTTQWAKTTRYNWLFIKAKLDYMNDMLKIQGHIFLNEVYDALGFPRTSAGSMVGWIRKGNGDGFISFGPWYEDAWKNGGRELGDFYPEGLLLDFNVDGVIYDLIEKPEYK